MKVIYWSQSGNTEKMANLILEGIELEESEMEPFVKSLEGNIQGKKVALFGSWGWGNGEWMTEWEKRMESYGATLISEGLTVQEYPKGEDEDKCINLGKLIGKYEK